MVPHPLVDADAQGATAPFGAPYPWAAVTSTFCLMEKVSVRAVAFDSDGGRVLKVDHA